MSRLGITFEQVELAAEQILLEGANPTIEKVRQFLGGTGSNSTIAKYLNDWKRARLIATRHDLPSASLAPDPVNMAVNRVWQEIREESNKEMLVLKEQFKSELEALKSQLAHVEKLHADVLLENSDLTNQLKSVIGEKELLMINLREIQQENALLLERNKGLAGQLQTTTTESTAAISTLKDIQARELASQQESLQHLQATHASMIKEIKEQTEKERHRLLEQNDKARVDLNKSEKVIKELQERLRNNNEIITDLKIKLATADNECDVVKKDLVATENNFKLILDENVNSTHLTLKHIDDLRLQQAELVNQILIERDNYLSHTKKIETSILNKMNEFVLSEKERECETAV